MSYKWASKTLKLNYKPYKSFSLQAQGVNANKFELQATAAAKQNYYLKDNSASSKDTVVNLLINNRSNMKDADIQLVFAYMKKTTM